MWKKCVCKSVFVWACVSDQLVAVSDLARLPSIELPFGNPDHNWELGIVFHITNAEGLTYVFNVNEAFAKLGIVFKVRTSSDRNPLKTSRRALI